MVSIFINGIKLKVPKNITILQACNLIKIEIPKFCFQENLQIAGNCRMCLVEVENSLKPIAACAMPITNNMKIFTDTPLVKKARESILEFLLINHPLDCPICDQASECDLQDHTMNFGSDKSRFFFQKRVVEDKYCGPFIKTIMTRCIHCTRCTRFVNEICKIDNLGTTGRGNKTEISFYNKNILNSEFSGNLIDLCPVGALTSKPFTFKARSWELKKKEGIDVLDSMGSNIQVDILNNEVVKIITKTNFYINNEWISNKTRFFFDSLKYQRIEYPLLKNNQNYFEEISWLKAFSIINNKLSVIDSSKIKAIIGNLTDLESIFFFFKKLTKIGINNIKFENYLNLNNCQINSDLTSNFLVKNIKLLEESELCLIINLNIRTENPLINIHLINRLKKGNFKVAYIGSKMDLTYPCLHLGNSFNILIQILSGQHDFCKILKKAKNPYIIFGEQILEIKNYYNIISKFRALSFLNFENINFLINKSAFINFLEIDFFSKQETIQNIKFLYLYNTNLKNFKVSKDNFIVYQGHHFTQNAQQANLILPGLTFLEKSGTYLNYEGWIQKNDKILNLKTNQKNDSIIFKYLYKYLIEKNKLQKKIIFLKFKNIFPYIKDKKKLNFMTLTNKFNQNLTLKNTYLTLLQKFVYFNNILEENSKILLKANKIIKLKYNYFFKN